MPDPAQQILQQLMSKFVNRQPGSGLHDIGSALLSASSTGAPFAKQLAAQESQKLKGQTMAAQIAATLTGQKRKQEELEFRKQARGEDVAFREKQLAETTRARKAQLGLGYSRLAHSKELLKEQRKQNAQKFGLDRAKVINQMQTAATKVLSPQGMGEYMKSWNNEMVDFSKMSISEIRALHSRTLSTVTQNPELVKRSQLKPLSDLGKIHADRAAGLISDEEHKQRLNKLMGRTAATAGKTAALAGAVKNLEEVFRVLMPGGKIDQGAMHAFIANAPRTEGRRVRKLVDDALSTKLRVETGVAARPDELQNLVARFVPSIFDNEATKIQKLQQLSFFLNTALEIADPALHKKMRARKGTKEKHSPWEGGFTYRGRPARRRWNSATGKYEYQVKKTKK